MSKKINVKSFIIGTVLGGLIFGSIIPISAAVQNVSAKLGTVNCKIDNTNTTLNSINYNNKNYVQLRDIVTKMGGNLAVERDTNTIVINSNQNEPVADDVSSNTATMAVQDTPTTSTTTDSQNKYDNSNLPNGMTYVDFKGFKCIKSGNLKYLPAEEFMQKYDLKITSYFLQMKAGDMMVEVPVKDYDGSRVITTYIITSIDNTKHFSIALNTNQYLKVNGKEYFYYFNFSEIVGLK